MDSWVEKDPMIRTRKFLEARDLWDEAKQRDIEEKAAAIVKKVIANAEGIEKPTTDDIFNDTFAELPEELRRQRDTLRTSSLGQSPEQAGLRSGVKAGV